MPEKVVFVPEPDACERCRGLAGPQAPTFQRPHDHCQCRIVRSRGRGHATCQREFHAVLSIEKTDIDYPEGDVHGDVPDEITIEYTAEILCKNDAEISVTFSLHYDGPGLKQLQAMDLEDAEGNLEADAEDRALSIADVDCPSCGKALS